LTAGDKKWRFERYLEQIMSKEHTYTRKAKKTHAPTAKIFCQMVIAENVTVALRE
jgi:hypothetical protein